MKTDTQTRRPRGAHLHRAGPASVLCMAGLLAPAAHAAGAGDWEWMVAPYGWVASFGVDLERDVPPEGGISTDTDFGDLVDDIDGAFQLHIEGQNERFGFFTDFTYLGLSSTQDYERFGTETDFDGRLFELAAVWSPGDGRYQGLDVFGGLRYIDIDLTARFDPENPAFDTGTFDGGESYSDFMLGARYTWDLTDRWGVTLRGDGSFGDTEGTWNGSAIANYKMSNGAWFFGYRYLAAELEARNSRTDISMHGPLVGYGFTF